MAVITSIVLSTKYKAGVSCGKAVNVLYLSRTTKRRWCCYYILRLFNESHNTCRLHATVQHVSIISVRFLYIAHTGKEEILVYMRNDDNSVEFSHVSEFRLQLLCVLTFLHDIRNRRFW